MNRFTITMNNDEYNRLEEMIAWYYETHGSKLSKCALIKQLLFGVLSDLRSEPAF